MRRLNRPETLAWSIISVGVALRLAHYLFNRSLWLDESMLALNVVHRSSLELLKPLDYNQVAPIGFLMLERLAIKTFGTGEYALRLPPLLAGILSLPLFYGVAKRCVAPGAVPVALGLFAVLDSLVYYSSEVKQYSIDVAITLLLFWLTLRFQGEGPTALGFALLGILGATAVWFSHPAVFVLAAIALSLSLSYVRKADWARIRSLVIACALWLVSFVVNYLLFLRNSTANSQQLQYWAKQEAFMPLPPISFSGFTWFYDTFLKIFNYPVRTHLAGLGAFTFLAGCVVLFNRKRIFLLLLAPAFFALLASSLHKYPFSDRLLLFLVPSLLLFMAEGAEHIRDRTRHHSKVVGTVLLVLLFLPSLLFARNRLLNPLTRQEIKPVLNYVRSHKQEGDLLYVYYGSQLPFEYYAARYGFHDGDYIVGLKGDWGGDDVAKLREDIKDLGDKLYGYKRVWLLFSDVHPRVQNEQMLYLYRLDELGTRLDSSISAGAAAYLYDLGPETSRRYISSGSSR